jgi:hypothetical protein
MSSANMPRERKEVIEGTDAMVIVEDVNMRRHAGW